MVFETGETNKSYIKLSGGVDDDDDDDDDDAFLGKRIVEGVTSK
jgi:hypothetical protein